MRNVGHVQRVNSAYISRLAKCLYCQRRVNEPNLLIMENLLEKKFPTYLNELKNLVRIPSVSFDGFPAGEVRRSAQFVADLMKKYGLENIQLLEIPGAHPYVYGERLKAPGKPTLLLYAHHDVQPPGREEVWETPPFEPTEKPGHGGTRLFGRGAADDKAGIVVHLAAIDSILSTGEELPVNVKVVIEGEEEVGSGHLKQFLSTYRSKLDADVMVLTDTTNWDCGIPAITIALRGLIDLNIELKSLKNPVHSGMFGGPVPDPAMALAKVLATLTDENGRIAVPGILEQVRPITPAEEKAMKALPGTKEDFRQQAGMLPGVELLEEGPSVFGQVWRFPSLAVNALQASSRQQAGNIIVGSAWAKVTIRLVADMDPEKTLGLLREFVKKQIPWGLHAEFQSDRGSPPWSIVPEGPAFEAAERALEKGYGRKPVAMGCGGSIPFVKPFAEALGGAPAILVGVEDPYTQAHGENESLLISDFKKACLSQIYLFQELGKTRL